MCHAKARRSREAAKSDLAGLPAPSAAQALPGRVISVVGRDPVPTAVVVLTGTQHHVFTDSAGAFSFDDVRAGRYELLVQHPGYHTLRRWVEVPPGGRTGLVLPLALNVTVLDPIRARVVAPLERWRRARGIAHHVYVDRAVVEEYVRRGALHVGDALRLHAPAAVHIIEAGVTRPRWGPAVCIKSTRAWTRRSVSNPDGGECAAVDVRRHHSYLAAGATAGFFTAFGVGYAHGLFREGAEFCTSDCTRDVLQMLGTVAVGLGVGELLYRLKTER